MPGPALQPIRAIFRRTNRQFFRSRPRFHQPTTLGQNRRFIPLELSDRFQCGVGWRNFFHHSPALRTNDFGLPPIASRPSRSGPRPEDKERWDEPQSPRRRDSPKVRKASPRSFASWPHPHSPEAIQSRSLSRICGGAFQRRESFANGQPEPVNIESIRRESVILPL